MKTIKYMNKKRLYPNFNSTTFTQLFSLYYRGFVIVSQVFTHLLKVRPLPFVRLQVQILEKINSFFLCFLWLLWLVWININIIIHFRWVKKERKYLLTSNFPNWLIGIAMDINGHDKVLKLTSRLELHLEDYSSQTSVRKMLDKQNVLYYLSNFVCRQMSYGCLFTPSSIVELTTMAQYQ